MATGEKTVKLKAIGGGASLARTRVGTPQYWAPEAVCGVGVVRKYMVYLPTLGEKWLHSRGNGGKYSERYMKHMGYTYTYVYLYIY